MKEKVRVASGQGFWGDLLTAPVEQVRGGQIDYLMLDYLAEVTMCIVQKQRARDPEAGYARDFIALMREILPDCVEKNIKVLSNAGGVNVEGCAEAIKKTAKDLGLSGKVKDRRCNGRRCSAAPSGISRKRYRDKQYGHGRTV